MTTKTTQMPQPETTQSTPPGSALARRWRLDPSRSSAEFRVPTYWGLVKMKGRFGTIAGTLDLGAGAETAVDLRIEAASLDTANRRRDEHLRSEDFFDVQRHPEVRFTAPEATLGAGGDTLHVKGELQTAGRAVQLELDATVNRSGGELMLEATAEVDQRQLGMTASPMGMIRPRARLTVRAQMVPASATAASGDFVSADGDGRA